MPFVPSWFPNPGTAMAEGSARQRILERLRAGSAVRPRMRNSIIEREAEWLQRQPPITNLAERFKAEQATLMGEVREVAGYETLPETVAAWLAEKGVRSVMLGTAPALEPMRARLANDERFGVHVFDRPLEQQKSEVFGVDCGITTARGAIAETGSVIVVPDAAEPRLLSLAPTVHLAVVPREGLHPTLNAYIRTGIYQAELPTNHVLISGPSRTADIELTLTLGVHGPRQFLVALVG